MHRVKRKGQMGRVQTMPGGDNPGEETRVNMPGPNQEVTRFQLNTAGGPLDEEFREKGTRRD